MAYVSHIGYIKSSKKKENPGLPVSPILLLLFFDAERPRLRGYGQAYFLIARGGLRV
jgi:hypothetical protein